MNKDGSQYITLEDQDQMFAVSITNIRGIIPISEDILYTVPPCAGDHIVCIVKLYGQLITIIDLLGIFGMKLREGTFRFIVVLEHKGKSIGIFAHNVNILTVSEKEISGSKAMPTVKNIIHDRMNYFIVDVQRLYEYINA